MLCINSKKYSKIMFSKIWLSRNNQLKKIEEVEDICLKLFKTFDLCFSVTEATNNKILFFLKKKWNTWVYEKA